ncbi:MbtH family protein [Streptacidiphilus sp. PB12-B1b]|uniref:MbtH family protein n=1 Tax=Streptacidiphilus sp. PB12-B1b TaxID=2705012 RepID=UPI0015F82421|nr:MbtH family protein [Streptacidiphilus sp. PB12-B1b]QMU77961.1 MbtH family protein [Streptacidiphilus sp. PB12-B1b]
MANPFEDPEGRYLVLVNDEGQHSLWPTFADVPAGWTIALAESGYDESLAWITEHWTDLRPRSVAEVMDRAA